MPVAYTCPLFFEKNNVIFTACGKLIQGISIITGELLYSLQGHDSSVNVCTLQSTKEGYKLFTGSDDGVIIEWDVLTSLEVKRHTLLAPIYDVILPKTKNDELILVMGKQLAEKQNVSPTSVMTQTLDYKLVVYDMNSSKTRRRLMDLKYPKKCAVIMEIANDEYVIAVSKRKLVVWSLDSRKGPKTVTDLSAMTCLATVGSNKDLVITGHQTGEISLWHDMRAWIQSQ
eukprot:gene12184-25580_t